MSSEWLWSIWHAASALHAPPLTLHAARQPAPVALTRSPGRPLPCSRLDAQACSPLVLAATHAHWQLVQLLLDDQRTNVPANLLQVAIAGVCVPGDGVHADLFDVLASSRIKNLCAHTPCVQAETDPLPRAVKGEDKNVWRRSETLKAESGSEPPAYPCSSTGQPRQALFV